jgi:hypothetical protein
VFRSSSEATKEIGSASSAAFDAAVNVLMETWTTAIDGGLA